MPITAKERDTESGLDYFLARYYSSPQGRFTSHDEFAGGPDEALRLGSGDATKQALPYADTTNPQSLNKYQYCYNNPLRYIDRDGHDIWGDLLELGSGIDRGYASSVSWGTFPNSTPSKHDSALSLIGQLIGTAIAAQEAEARTDGGINENE